MLRDLARVREAMHAPTGRRADRRRRRPRRGDRPRGRRSTAAAGRASGRRRPTPRRGPGRGRAGAAACSAGGRGSALVGARPGRWAAAVGWANRPDDLLSARPAEARRRCPASGSRPTGRRSRRRRRPRSSTATPRSAPRARPGGRLAGRPRLLPRVARLGLAGLHPARPPLLLPRHDADRLRVFADEIDRWNGAQHRTRRSWPTIIQAAVKALDGDLDGVLADFDQRLDLRRPDRPGAARAEPGGDRRRPTQSASRPGRRRTVRPRASATIQKQLLAKL